MRVLIVKTSALGDIVQAFPVISYLKEVQHVKTIGWAAEESAVELLSSHPYIDEVIPISSKEIKRKMPFPSAFCEFLFQRRGVREKKWDIVFDLQGNCKSACVTFMARSKMKVGWGFQHAPEKISSIVLDKRYNPSKRAPMRDQYLSIPQTYFQDKSLFIPRAFSLQLTENGQKQYLQEIGRWPSGRPVWVISLGSKWINKLCDVDEIAKALAVLQNEYNMYYLFTAATTLELNRAGACLKQLQNNTPGHVVYQLPLPVLQHLIAHAGRFIGVDSLMLHLASTTQAPTFSLFGPSSAAIYAPHRAGDRFLQGDCPRGISFIKRCPHIRTCQTPGCIKRLKAKQIEHALRLWKQSEIILE